MPSTGVFLRWRRKSKPEIEYLTGTDEVRIGTLLPPHPHPLRRDRRRTHRPPRPRPRGENPPRRTVPSRRLQRRRQRGPRRRPGGDAPPRHPPPVCRTTEPTDGRTLSHLLASPPGAIFIISSPPRYDREASRTRMTDPIRQGGEERLRRPARRSAPATP